MAREKIATLRVSLSESARVQLLTQTKEFDRNMTDPSQLSTSRTSMSSSCSSLSSRTSNVPFRELEPSVTIGPMPIDNFMDEVRESRDYPTSREAAIEAVELLRECHRIEVSSKALAQLSEDVRVDQKAYRVFLYRSSGITRKCQSSPQLRINTSEKRCPHSTQLVHADESQSIEMYEEEFIDSSKASFNDMNEIRYTSRRNKDEIEPMSPNKCEKRKRKEKP
ncbi:uncharacterized protein MELLADRAFT_64531 [Melampsora larici-populina 98AG31]|uniref:Uncharacterized protein n=1 Tax=Melampsora larici-populina (strain 98AG31 / pathotype 3-4-7) TaxID=747676 RepID=F4RRT0_MELLP|nr:uncharacterized protein MELLADRAFT_64531 [Melampsora larici-populina 98AG31]EGG04736.1 hypothetical protein MELLADRAFT_64531 [Melampsora larici-populina 98AG31]